MRCLGGNYLYKASPSLVFTKAVYRNFECAGSEMIAHVKVYGQLEEVLISKFGYVRLGMQFNDMLRSTPAAPLII